MGKKLQFTELDQYLFGHNRQGTHIMMKVLQKAVLHIL